MSEPVLTSASNVEEGNEVSLGGRWQVVEDAQQDGEIVILWAEGAQYVFAVEDQLRVVK
jgi:uncharacterized protein YheU (UPF0270 family)